MLAPLALAAASCASAGRAAAGGVTPTSAMQGSAEAQEAQQTLHVPNLYVGAIIGAQGAKIAELQRVSQARIVIEKEQNDPRAISVSGPALAVAGAVSMLNEVLDAEKLRMAGGGAASRPPGDHTVEIVAQGSRCGVVIGRGGDNIRELQARSGARIQVSREPDAENCRTITISGTEVQVAVARQRVDELLQHGDVPPTSQPAHAAQQPLPPHHPQAAQQPHYPMYPTPPPGPPPPLPFPPPTAGAAGGAEPQLEVEIELQASSQALQMLLSTPAMMQQLHASLGAGVRAHVRPERDAVGLRPVRLSGDAARVHGVKLLVQACEVRRGRLSPPSRTCTHLSHTHLPHTHPSTHAPVPTLPSAAALAPLRRSRAPHAPFTRPSRTPHARAAWAVRHRRMHVPRASGQSVSPPRRRCMFTTAPSTRRPGCLTSSRVACGTTWSDTLRSSPALLPSHPRPPSPPPPSPPPSSPSPHPHPHPIWSE